MLDIWIICCRTRDKTEKSFPWCQKFGLKLPNSNYQTVDRKVEWISTCTRINVNTVKEDLIHSYCSDDVELCAWNHKW